MMKKLKELNAFIITNDALKETLENIGWKTFISEIKRGFEQSALGQAVVPAKVYVDTGGSDMRCMPAYLPRYNPKYCGVKIVTTAPANKKLGLPTVLGEYLLRDAETQQLVAIMQAEEMTAYRTGAATGIYQAMAILTVRDSIDRIKVFDISEQRAMKFRAKYEPEFGIDIAVVSLEDAVDSDIVTTVTPATEPFIYSDLIKPGMHLNGVGADSKTKIEFDPKVLKKARMFIDDFSQCLHSGEIYRGLEKGIVAKGDLISLGDVLLGKAEGRTSKDDITFFKSTGVAFQDLITAIMVFEGMLDKKIKY
jgi:ornithine cyclodeaminase/alanine dehydrogenase-like protein (mu-crystallin family)